MYGNEIPRFGWNLNWKCLGSSPRLSQQGSQTLAKSNFFHIRFSFSFYILQLDQGKQPMLIITDNIIIIIDLMSPLNLFLNFAPLIDLQNKQVCLAIFKPAEVNTVCWFKKIPREEQLEAKSSFRYQDSQIFNWGIIFLLGSKYS